MRILIFLLLALPTIGFSQNGNNSTTYYFKGRLAVGRGDILAPISPSLLEVGNGNDNRGFVLPRLGSVLSMAVAPAQGLVIYDKSNNTIKYHTGSEWKELSTGGGASVTFKTETFTGAATYNLTSTPVEQSITIFVNGKQEALNTLVGSTISILAGYTIEASDIITVKYITN